MKLFGHLNKDRDIAVLAGAFNPPTIAHWQLALAARRHVGQTLLVVPGRLPHKDPRRASLDERVDLLRDLDPDLPIAVTDGGLFIDIAREIRRDAQIGGRIYFACGSDAAQRIVEWDYGDTLDIRSQLEEYELLVASRLGRFDAPPDLDGRVHNLDLDGAFDDVSSTEVRDRIALGLDWESLVPPSAVERVRKIYSRR